MRKRHASMRGRRFITRFAFGPVLVFAAAQIALGQPPADDWRTVTLSAKNPKYKKLYEAFNRLYHEPSAGDYQQALSELAVDPSYNPWSKDMDDMAEFVNTNHVDKAYFLYEDSMPNLALCPQAHFLASAIVRKAGNDLLADVEGRMGWALDQSILKTGDGTRANPYLVGRTSDEYDLFEFEWHKKVESWEVITETGGRHLDHLRSTDGHDYWFDWTVMFRYGKQNPAKTNSQRANGQPPSDQPASSQPNGQPATNQPTVQPASVLVRR